jgi:hypothetical protein
MQLVLKAIIPSIEEVAWYALGGSFLLIALNITGIIDVLFTLSQTDADVRSYVDNSFVGFLQDIANPLNGRLGNSVVWALMGVVAFLLGSIAISEIQDLFDHTEQAIDTPRRFRMAVWVEFAVRMALRTVAFAGVLMWAYVFVSMLSPYASRLLLESLLATPAYAWGLLAFCVGSTLFSIWLYIGAVLCRFVALRVRVFSDKSWAE